MNLKESKIETLLYWISERMSVYNCRQQGQPAPWTYDPILTNYKFTNVYRILDKESQTLMRDIFYNGKKYSFKDTLVRALIFRHFNLTSTWEAIIREFGDVTSDTSFVELAEFLGTLKGRIYNSAYIISAGHTISHPKYRSYVGRPKYTSYFDIFENEILDPVTLDRLKNAKSLKRIYQILHRVTSFGEFIAWQMAIDLNYSPLYSFDENSYVVAGLGAKRGIRQIFGKTKYRDDEVIEFVTSNLSQLMDDYGFNFEPLPGHMPTLMDIQNCFCEIDKFLRIKESQKKTSMRKYRAERGLLPKKPKDPVFPPEWNINN